MEFTRLLFLALLCLVVFVGTDASLSADYYWQQTDESLPAEKADYYWRQTDAASLPAEKAEIYSQQNDASLSAEDYWRQSVGPNTPLPKALLDLLKPHSGTKLPIKAEEEKQFGTLFFEHDLHPGKKMSSSFHKHFDIQPFGVKIWGQLFGLRSLRGKAIETERYLKDFCGNKGAIGEDKYCASSLESMMDFAISKLGKNIKVISSSFAQNQDQYMVEEVRKIGEKSVMCHRMNVENVVFYCHQVNATTSYMVSLVASDGTKAKALTVCHHDTRGMNPNALYQILKVKPGTVPVCHFIGNKASVWVPNNVVSESNHPYVS